MVKKTIIYENYNGETKEMTAYFHLSKTEATILSSSKIDGVPYIDALNKSIEEQDVGAMITILKDVVIRSYGVKSEDGETFVKNKEAAERFANSPAFDALFDDLLYDSTEGNNISDFITALIPKLSKNNVPANN